METRRGGELIAGIIVFFVILFVYTKVLGPIPFSVNNINTNKTDSFQVQGTGKAAAAPDKAVLNLGISQDSSSVLDAQNQVNQAYNKILDALKKLGVSDKDIKTTNYSVNPRFGPNGQKSNSFTVTQSIEVKAPIEKANQVIDLATGNGANLVGGITYVLDDEKEADLENQARAEAVAKAKQKAQGLARAAGIRLGRIINVTEDFGGSPIPLALDAKQAGSGPETPTNISPGETNVQITVTLSYETF